MSLGGGVPPPGCVLPLMGPFKRPPPTLSEEPKRGRPFLSRTPWIAPGSRRLPGVLGLHQEIEDFYAWMLPTTLEHNLRLDVVERIRGAINDLFPAARVEISGSFRTGLYLPTSDIDLVICGKWETLPLRTIEHILLEKKIASPDSLRVLDKAAVPIVKLTDMRSDIKVDISFNMSNGVRAAELIKHFKKRYPSLPKLIYVLKQFLLQRDLNEVFTGGLSSYSLILLVISYLQHHYSQETASSASANLGVMLIEILELYGRNFNFMNTAIRITDGGSYISKTKFQKVIANGYAPALLSIEDPLDPTNDVGRSSYGFVAVQNSFDRAFAVLTSLVVAQTSVPDGKSILSSIVEIPEEVSEYRIWMRDQFPFLGSPHNYMIPAVPPQYVRAPLEFITPRELPSVRFTSKEVKDKFSQHSGTPPAPVNSNNGNDLSDCLSSVSTGTCPSQSSPLDSLSDTDSDVLIGPTMTPYSAMSISPANSEIGGSSIGGRESLKHTRVPEGGGTPIRTKQKGEAPSKRCPSSSSSNSSRGSPSDRRCESINGGSEGGTKQASVGPTSLKNRPSIPRTNNNNNMNSNVSNKHSQKDRSDSVQNWRSPERRKKVLSASVPDDKHQSSSSSSTTSTSFDTSKALSTNNSSIKVHHPSEGRADRDSNWREREQMPRDRNGNTQHHHSNSNNNILGSSSADNNNQDPNNSAQLHHHPVYHSHSNVTASNNHSNNNLVVSASGSLTTSSALPPKHHFSVTSNSNNGTLVKQKKKHKKNHSKSSFKYINSQKVKENEKYIESSKDNGSSYLEGCKDSGTSPSMPSIRGSASNNSGVGGNSSLQSSLIKSSSSMKKRKKSHKSLSLGDESNKGSSSEPGVSEVPLHHHSISSRFSPKAGLGNGKR